VVGSGCWVHRMVMTLHSTTHKSRCGREGGAAEASLRCDGSGSSLAWHMEPKFLLMHLCAISTLVPRAARSAHVSPC